MPHSTLEKRRAYLAANKARLDVAARKWRAEHRKQLVAYSKEYHRTHKIEDRNYDRFRRLGITPEQFETKLAEQGYVCGLCGLPFDGMKKFDAPRADHDHSTGEFRGVLHRHCNLGIGTFHENVELLAKAILYLQKFKREESNVKV